MICKGQRGRGRESGAIATSVRLSHSRINYMYVCMERERDRETERERDSERDTERDRETETERQTDRVHFILWEWCSSTRSNNIQPSPRVGLIIMLLHMHTDFKHKYAQTC